MPLSRSRDYLSIGEVLDELRKEFPDVSISKIRFLEAEGLIAPERTGSGYRKFYEPDVERLRYILSLQRDHFMPLRVIRERLATGNGGAPATVVPLPTASAPAAAPVADVNILASGVQLDRKELLKAAGLAEEQMAGLEEYGILDRKEGSGYDENDLVAAKAARRFFEFGVEPRHLRMYKQFADRETAFFEQIVSPLSHRRTGGDDQVGTAVRELAALSRQLKEAALQTRLRDLL
jgi:DNA-binding transcriptional MerR regulator